MGFPYSEVALSFLKSKLVLIGGGSAVAAGVATPISLTVVNFESNEKKVSDRQLTSYFSESNINKLIEGSKVFQQKNPSKGQQTWPSDADRQTFLSTMQQINNSNQKSYMKLSKDQRESLLSFFRLYEELEHSKNTQNRSSSDSPALLDGLSEINWGQDQIKFFKDGSVGQESKWGWSTWDNKNPFWVVYDKDENKWTEKMNRLGSESSLKEEVSKEMEYDISSKILGEITRIHETYMK